MLRIFSLIFFLLAVFTTPFALIEMMKPAVMPLPTIIGAGLLPAFFWWFAFLLHKRASAASQAKGTEKPK